MNIHTGAPNRDERALAGMFGTDFGAVASADIAVATRTDLGSAMALLHRQPSILSAVMRSIRSDVRSMYARPRQRRHLHHGGAEACPRDAGPLRHRHVEPTPFDDDRLGLAEAGAGVKAGGRGDVRAAAGTV